MNRRARLARHRSGIATSRTLGRRVRSTRPDLPRYSPTTSRLPRAALRRRSSRPQSHHHRLHGLYPHLQSQGIFRLTSLHPIPVHHLFHSPTLHLLPSINPSSSPRRPVRSLSSHLQNPGQYAIIPPYPPTRPLQSRHPYQGTFRVNLDRSDQCRAQSGPTTRARLAPPHLQTRMPNGSAASTSHHPQTADGIGPTQIPRLVVSPR